MVADTSVMMVDWPRLYFPMWITIYCSLSNSFSALFALIFIWIRESEWRNQSTLRKIYIHSTLNVRVYIIMTSCIISADYEYCDHENNCVTTRRWWMYITWTRSVVIGERPSSAKCFIFQTSLENCPRSGVCAIDNSLMDSDKAKWPFSWRLLIKLDLHHIWNFHLLQLNRWWAIYIIGGDLSPGRCGFMHF